MKKLMFAAAALAAGFAMADGITSSNIVGYQNKGFGSDMYNITAATFTKVDGSTMKLGDLIPNEDFIASKICFMTKTGANEKTKFGSKTVNRSFCYWFEEDDPANGAGWYLEADEDGEGENFNNTEIPFGDGFMVYRDVGEKNADLVYSGQVKASPTTKGFDHDMYTPVGNCSPSPIKLGDITVNEDFIASKICLMTKTGANQKTTFGSKTVNKSFCYWFEEDDPANGAGWYLEADEDGEGENFNNTITFEAGEGFMVYRDVGEKDAEITVPSAL